MSMGRTIMFQVMGALLLACLVAGSCFAQVPRLREPQSSVEYQPEFLQMRPWRGAESADSAKVRTLILEVVDSATGEPIRKMTVATFTRPDEPYGQILPAREPLAMEQASGVYEVANLPLQKTSLVLVAEGKSPAVAVFEADSADTRRRVEMKPPLEIRGRMVDAVTKEPVGGLQFGFNGQCEILGLPWGHSMVTREDGTFDLHGMPVDEYVFSTAGDREVRTHRVVDSEMDAHMLRRLGKQVDKPPYHDVPRNPPVRARTDSLADYGDIEVPRGAIVNVTVRDAAGAPLGFMPLEVSGPGRLSDWRTTHSGRYRTNADGKASFVVRRLAEEVPLAVHVSTDGDDAFGLPFGDRWRPLDNLDPAKMRRAIEEQGHEVESEDLDERVEWEAKEAKEQAARRALPPHPAASEVDIAPNGVCNVELVYRPAEGRPGPLKVVDAETGEPVAMARGYISEPSPLLDAQMLNTIGTAEGLREFGRMLDALDKLPEFGGRSETGEHPFPPNAAKPRWKDAPLSVGAYAPGYVPRVTLATWEQLMAEKPFVVKLARAASLKGRLVDDATGAPIGPPVVAKGSPAAFAPGPIMLHNDALLKVQQSAMTRPDGGGSAVLVPGELAFGTDAEGHFRIDGLPVADGWKLTVTLDGHADATREFDLHAGENDLGEVRLKGAAALNGKVVLKDGVPVEGALAYFLPLVDAISMQIPREDGRTCVASDKEGRFTLSLRGASTPDMVLRIVPPWGFEKKRAGDALPGTMFDYRPSLDLESTQDATFTVDPGHTVRVTLKPFAGGGEMLERAKALSRRMEGDKMAAQVQFFLGHGVVVSLDGGEGAPIFHQMRPLPGTPMDAIHGAARQIDIPSVPAGRHMIVISGEMDNPARCDTSRPLAGIPVYAAEFDMPAQDTELVLERRAATVTFKLQEADFGKLPGREFMIAASVHGARTAGPIRLLDDIARGSLGGGAERRSTPRSRAASSEDYFTDVLMAFEGGMMVPGSDTEVVLSLPAPFEYDLAVQSFLGITERPGVLAKTTLKVEDGQAYSVNMGEFKVAK